MVDAFLAAGRKRIGTFVQDDAYGMIKWKQAQGKLQSWGLDFTNPDFVAFAQAHGAHGHRIEKTADLLPKLKQCLGQPGVHIIDVPIDYSSTDHQMIVNIEAAGPRCPSQPTRA